MTNDNLSRQEQLEQAFLAAVSDYTVKDHAAFMGLSDNVQKNLVREFLSPVLTQAPDMPADAVKQLSSVVQYRFLTSSSLLHGEGDAVAAPMELDDIVRETTDFVSNFVSLYIR